MILHDLHGELSAANTDCCQTPEWFAIQTHRNVNKFFRRLENEQEFKLFKPQIVTISTLVSGDFNLSKLCQTIYLSKLYIRQCEVT